MKINSKLYNYTSRKGKYHYLYDRKVVNRKNYHVLEVVQNENILSLLRMLNIQHEEKVKRKKQAIEFLTKERIINNYYFSLLYHRLYVLGKPITIGEFAQKNNLSYPLALNYLLYNVKKGFIQKTGRKYVISEKGKNFITYYETVLKA